MRLKRMIALLCASLYILTGTAAAGEITKEETEQQIVLEAGVPAAEEGRAVSQNAAPQMLSARAALKTVPSTHKVTVNGQAVSPIILTDTTILSYGILRFCSAAPRRRLMCSGMGRKTRST